ncbi:MAG: cytidylate kinase-like family protein [Bacteroidales bacterium]|nr:cytidylate kinase-like family protein [Bacteroidales bacterium]MBQ1904901.1 cytidylate kinase-like family protein [Bacteroidales bacterium]MBQ2501571.1 cytidylate kinase-like family protein [Bacteroidales bacterium]MBQ3976331.1 cytidylate kinase-like family protein [Bacteroidales bacterium]MBQ3985321.1 cytidylate kinase-like family protein [Bacteroidales bacterium]
MEKHILITIGRQFGSGGKPVGDALSRKLGIPVYDNELITEAAKQSGYSPELFIRSDEKKRSFFLANLFGLSSDVRNMIGDAELFRIQSETIRNLASKGSAIFVGRASDYVLRDMKCLNVFITASMESRIKFVCERDGVALEDAPGIIERRDRNRSKYYDFFTQKHWGLASNYDICINRSTLGTEKTADLIIEFGKMRGLI